MPEVNNNPDADTFKQLAQLKAKQRGEVADETEELPQGASQVTEGEETAEVEAAASEEASEEIEGAAEEGAEIPAVADEEEEEPIRIAGREFKSAKEAFAYAEQLEREKLLAEAHSQGIREALEAQRAQSAVPQEEPEDDFEEQFYKNPKETLTQIQQKARDEAVAMIRAEQAREKLWNDFLTEYPDIRRRDAERILNENMDTIGRLTDINVAKRQLAQRVREEYEEIVNLRKPKTVLERKTQAVSPSGGARTSVTQPKKEEKVLSFSEQLRKLKG